MWRRRLNHIHYDVDEEDNVEEENEWYTNDNVEKEIEVYSDDIWDALLDIYDTFGNFNTTSTMLCSKCGKPEPYSERLDSPCTECCLQEESWSIEQVMDNPKFSSWKLAKEELDMILDDLEKQNVPFKKSLEDRYTEKLHHPMHVYPETDYTTQCMRLDYMSFLKKNCPPALLDMIVNFRHDDKYILLERVFVRYMSCDRVHQDAKSLLSFPHHLQWYPRKTTGSKRCVTFHYGRTNSRRTFRALKRFKEEGKSAIYCAPLSLLAMQIYQHVNKRGILCDLKTGEDVKHHSGSVKCCCTVEMVDLSKKWKVGVIDEIQMIGDELRGWAWTRAFLGLNAEEIHLCGDGSVKELIENLCKLTGDRLTMVEHYRRNRLVVEKEVFVLGKSKIESGDCFVAFSVRRLKEIKKTILHQQPDLKCTLLYGSLPPEVQFEAAKKFLEDSKIRKGVLLATDYIAMGLNIPIRRVIFTETEKYDRFWFYGLVEIQLMKQIAGRAGRGSEIGYCTATDIWDLKYLKKCVKAPIEPIKQAVLDLDPKILRILEHRWRKLGQFQPSTFVRYLERIGKGVDVNVNVEDAYSLPLFRFRTLQSEFLNLAHQIARKGLMPRITLSDFFKLCNCPCDDPFIVVSWMTHLFSSFTECSFNCPNNCAFDYNMNEYTFEGVYSLVRAYKYLYNQFPKQRYLMIHYNRLPELELQIKKLIRQKEKREEEYWLRYHSNSDG